MQFGVANIQYQMLFGRCFNSDESILPIGCFDYGFGNRIARVHTVFFHETTQRDGAANTPIKSQHPGPLTVGNFLSNLFTNPHRRRAVLGDGEP